MSDSPSPSSSASAAASLCPQCGSRLPADAPQGLCPACLMAAAALDTEADTQPLGAARELPTLAEVAAAFPDLEVQELIGQGGMSVVYRARQPRLERVVALKILPKDLAATPGFPQRFTREGRVLARLTHPNIVTVHDFGESGGFYFLLMEYVDGVNLRQAMRAGRFTPEQALEVVPVLCAALQHAHGEGVLHRDIKPENILLDAKGRVKIADFGIAKIIGENADAMLLTQSGARLGTAPYMAPEQIEQPATVDHRADIYSLGVVFYEMLTGELPLGRFAAPSERAAVGSQVDAVVFRALEKERGRRQQSAGEFKTQIEGLGSGAPPAAVALAWRHDSFEYKSKRTLLGMPLLHVTAGSDPLTGQRRVARGFFAFGDTAIGVVACGGYARGLVAFGGCAVGGIAIGGVSLGVLSWGAVALALVLAFGGLAVGPLATGGLAVGWQAMGAVAAGWHAIGATVFAQHGMGGTVHAPHVFKAMSEAPAALRWLASISGWTMLGTFLWLPLMLPPMLVPWWARKQLEARAAGRQADTRAGRVFWIIPAAAGLCMAVVALVLALQSAAGKEHQFMISPVVVSLLGLAIAALNVPLILHMVPPNRFYGIRLRASFQSAQRWYEVNEYGGRLFAGWGTFLMAAGLCGFFILPKYQDLFIPAIVALSMLCVFLPVAQTLWWVHRRLPVQGPPPRSRHRDFFWGKALAAIGIAFFLRTFVLQAFVAWGQSMAPEVPPNTWVLAWKLVPKFAAGDFITYDHEDKTYLGRVTRVEENRLWITRNNTPELAVDMQRVSGRLVLQSRPSNLKP